MGRTRRRWVDNINHDVRVLGSEGTWTEEGTNNTEWRKIPVTTFGSLARQ